MSLQEARKSILHLKRPGLINADWALQPDEKRKICKPARWVHLEGPVNIIKQGADVVNGNAILQDGKEATKQRINNLESYLMVTVLWNLLKSFPSGSLGAATTTVWNRTATEQKQNGRRTEAELMQNRKHLPICANWISVESPQVLSRGAVLWIIRHGIHNRMK